MPLQSRQWLPPDRLARKSPQHPPAAPSATDGSSLDDSADYGAAVADGGAKGLRLRERREFLAAAGGGRPAVCGHEVGGVLQAEFLVGGQGFFPYPQSVGMGTDSR